MQPHGSDKPQIGYTPIAEVFQQLVKDIHDFGKSNATVQGLIPMTEKVAAILSGADKHLFNDALIKLFIDFNGKNYICFWIALHRSRNMLWIYRRRNNRNVYSK